MKPERVPYAGLEIVALRIPTTDGRWLATYEIMQTGRKAHPLLSGSPKPFIHDDQDEAYAAACSDAMRKIDQLGSMQAA